MKGQYVPNHRNDLQQYLAQKVLTASPEQLIAYIFDVSLAACARRDREKASKAVQELMNGLNFDYQEMATTFFQMYRYTLNAIQEGRFEEAREILAELKTAWKEAMKVV